MPTPRRASRGVSEVVGVILIAVIITLGISVILMYGGYTVSQMKEDARLQHAENAFIDFDNTIATLALSNSATQTEFTFGFSNQYGGGLAIDDRGHINISLIDTGAGTTNTMVNTSLGAVIYENSGSRLVYQNGGVWRTDEATQNRQMVSPPEITTRSGTLSVSVVRIDQTTRFMGDSLYLITTKPTTTPVAASLDGDTKLRITIQSEYYRQWGAYAKLTLNGANVTYRDTTDTVVMDFKSADAGGEIRQVYVSNSTVGN